MGEWHQIKELGNNVWWFDTDCMHNALCQHAPILMPFEHGLLSDVAGEQ